MIERIAHSGGTPLAVSRGGAVVGVVHLKDVVRPGMREQCEELRRMGVRTVMVTGDNRADRGNGSGSGGCRRLRRPGEPAGQAPAAARGTGQGPARRRVRRRRQRCAGPGPGRSRHRSGPRRRRGARGREHGRPRQRSDEADRGHQERPAHGGHTSVSYRARARRRPRQVSGPALCRLCRGLLLRNRQRLVRYHLAAEHAAGWLHVQRAG